MTTTRNFRYGKHTCKAYKRPAGKGWEVGFTFGPNPIFVGNFIHPAEANAWWSMMNKEIRRFSKRYWTTPKAPMNWYTKFLSHYLYKTYYNFLDKKFSKYQRDFNSACRKHERRYTSLKKHWPTPAPRVFFRHAA